MLMQRVGGAAKASLRSSRSLTTFGRAPSTRSILRTMANSAMRSSSSMACREPLLFTPGPLTTSPTVKQAMLCDLGSRDPLMMNVVQEIRDELLKLGHVSQEAGYECVLMQGSGTFSVEAVLSSVIPANGRLLLVINGAYGDRMAKMAEMCGIPYEVLRFPEDRAVEPEAVAEALAASKFTHVAVVHHETTAGTLNDLAAIGAAAHGASPDTTFIVDSMSAFGAYDVDLAACHVDFLVSSANKAIEGVPGFGYALCRRDKLESEGVNARSLSLDLLGQWKGLEGNGQFRFTPPTHAMLAFRQALREHEQEGGCAGRLARYQRNFEVLRDGMAKLGFKLYVPAEYQSAVISTFLHPDDPNFDFERFYQDLASRGLVIYPGKLTKADCFRIGSIGRMFESDMRHLVLAVEDVLRNMGVKMPVTQIQP